MLVFTYKARWHHNPEDHNPHFHWHEKLKSHSRTPLQRFINNLTMFYYSAILTYEAENWMWSKRDVS
jgi:hypothetical protein